MQFDIVIIGGGLAGLCCGIELLKQGKRCALVSTGQNALHFSSGSFDLLNHLPDGTQVEYPIEALNSLMLQEPTHPYVVMGTDKIADLAQQAKTLLTEAGIALKGDHHKNHQRITPLGGRRATWMSAVDVPTAELGEALPWHSLAIVSIEGFLDFQPELAADRLRGAGVDVQTHYLHLPELDRVRANPSEFRAVNIARALDLPDTLTKLADEINALKITSDAIIMPACVGLDDKAITDKLAELVGKPIYYVSTLPPSLLGIRAHHQLSRQFQRLGGVYMPGDTVLNADIDGNEIKAIYTRNHGDISLKADHFVLATGSFFSNGLVAEFDEIREPIFNLDVDKTDSLHWTAPNFFDAQPYMKFGVMTNEKLNGQINGQSITNLYVAGALLGGFNPLNEGCGAGVSLLSALHIANTIHQIEEQSL